MSQDSPETSFSIGNPAPTGNPTGNPSGNPTGNPAGNSAGNPTGNSAGNPTGNPARNPVGKPNFNLFGQSKEFHSQLDTKAAEEILEKGILTRTLSDTKIDAFSKIDLNENDLTNNHEFKTLPTNINKRNVSYNSLFQFRFCLGKGEILAKSATFPTRSPLNNFGTYT